MANTHPRGASRVLPLALATALVPLAIVPQGCVVWEIRDGIRESNYNVAEANRRVGEATAQVQLAREHVAEASGQITRADVAIETANSRMASVEGRIVTTEARIASTEDRIKSTEHRLEEVEGVLENRITQTNQLITDVKPTLDRLTTIDPSLNHIDAHLRSVRKTLNSLSDQMPFFELDADPIDAVPPPPVAAGEGGDAAAGTPPTERPAAAAAPEGAAPSGVAPAPAAGPAKRELLLGTWLREHPAKGAALVILDDGTYILDANGPDSERGTWKRDGPDTVVFTPTTLAPAPPAQPGQPPAPARPHPERKYKVLGRAVRVLTLDGGDAGLVVYSRP